MSQSFYRWINFSFTFLNYILSLIISLSESTFLLILTMPTFSSQTILITTFLFFTKNFMFSSISLNTICMTYHFITLSFPLIFKLTSRFMHYVIIILSTIVGILSLRIEDSLLIWLLCFKRSRDDTCKYFLSFMLRILYISRTGVSLSQESSLTNNRST